MGRPLRAARVASTAGCPTSSVPGIAARRMSTVSKRPVPRTSSATASALRSTSRGSNPGNAMDGMRTSAPRSARADGMPDAAASRTASCRFGSELMRVILSAPLTNHRGSPVAKTPAAPAPNDAPSDGIVDARRQGARDPQRAPSRRRLASAPSCPTRKRRRRARRRTSPCSARRPASAWRQATPSTSRLATRGRSASSCATSWTAAGTSPSS